MGSFHLLSVGTTGLHDEIGFPLDRRMWRRGIRSMRKVMKSAIRSDTKQLSHRWRRSGSFQNICRSLFQAAVAKSVSCPWAARGAGDDTLGTIPPLVRYFNANAACSGMNLREQGSNVAASAWNWWYHRRSSQSLDICPYTTWLATEHRFPPRGDHLASLKVVGRMAVFSIRPASAPSTGRNPSDRQWIV